MARTDRVVVFVAGTNMFCGILCPSVSRYILEEHRVSICSHRHTPSVKRMRMVTVEGLGFWVDTARSSDALTVMKCSQDPYPSFR